MAIQVRIQGDKQLAAQLERLGIRVQDVLETACQAGAKVIEAKAETQAPGPYIDQETAKKTSKRVVVQVGPDKKHWYYQFAETGAAPHVIQGRRKKAVAFTGSGGPVVRRSVQHPGRSKRPFLRPAVDSNGPEIQQAVGNVLKSAVTP